MKKTFSTFTMFATACVLACGAAGCLDDSGNASPGGNNLPTQDGGDQNPFPQPDGSSSADGGVNVDSGIARQGFVPGFGSGGTVTRSAHFTLITRTGGEPGGAGVKTSGTQTIISGMSPPAK